MSELKQKPDYKAVSFRITDGYIYLMLFLFPLFTGFEGYENITFSKYIFFVSATALWLISVTVCALAGGRTVFTKRRSFIAFLIFLYLIICCISSVFSSYKTSVLIGGGRFDGLLTTFLCVSITLGVSVFARPKRSYLYAAAAAAAINCVVAVLQVIGHNPLWLFPGDFGFYDAGIKFSSTFFGTIGNADLFSAYICLILPFVCVHYITSEKRPLLLLPAVLALAFCLFSCGVSGGILAFAVTVLFAAPFVISGGERFRRSLELILLLSASALLAISFKAEMTDTGVICNFSLSRLSYLAIVIIAVAAVLRLVLRKSDFEKKTLRVFFSALSAVLIVSGFAAANFWKGTEGTVYELSQILHGNLKDSFGSSRILIWRKSLELVPGHLLLGSGSGTLALRLDLDFTRFVEETGNTLSTTVDNAHNDYLGILVNTGLLSLIAYVLAQGLSLIKTVKTATPTALCLACALLCYWVQAFFGLGLFLVSPLMWLLWGLLVSAFRHNKS